MNLMFYECCTTENLIKAWLRNMMHDYRILLPQGRSSFSHGLCNLILSCVRISSLFAERVSTLLNPACLEALTSKGFPTCLYEALGDH